MLLIDKIRAEEKKLLDLPPEWEHTRYFLRVRMLLLEHLPVLCIQNVANYFFTDPKFDSWTSRDFPNVAPPFPRFWLEYTVPTNVSTKIGVLVTSTPSLIDNRVAKWDLQAELFDYDATEAPFLTGPLGTVHIDVNAEGLIDQLQYENLVDLPSEQAKTVIQFLFPALLAVSFLHCKNVEVVQNRVPKPLAKKWHARYNQWPSPYQTLVIEPLKQILKHEGHADTAGVKLAMHICRGHFKDYREGAGLFGKHHVLVWHPSIVRGTVRYDQDECEPPRQMEIRRPKQ